MTPINIIIYYNLITCPTRFRPRVPADAFLTQSKIIHILFNNGIHESTGEHNTTNQKISFIKIFTACGYKKCFLIKKIISLKKILKKKMSGPVGIEVMIKPGTIDTYQDLQRNLKNY